MKTENCYVYTYSYPNGVPFYVGIGSGHRMQYHLTCAKNNRKDVNQYKKNIIQKILREGQEPIIKKIVDNIDREFAALIEQEFIAKYGRRSEGGLLVNMTAGGEGMVGLSKESEMKRRQSLIAAECFTRFKKGHDNSAAIAAREGMDPWNKGIPCSDETKAKISAAITPYAMDPIRREQSKQRMTGNKYREGVPHTEETKEKMRQAKLNAEVPNKKGKKLSGDAYKNVAKSNRVEWTCPHCGKHGMGTGAKNRWHFNNCKTKDQK